MTYAVSDVSMLDRVPQHRRWGLMLSRLDHQAPYLTKEECWTLLPDEAFREYPPSKSGARP